MRKIILTSLCPLPALLLLMVVACSNKNGDGDLYWTDPPTAADTLYQNPLFEPDLADPSFVRASDGWFYAYGTQNTWAQGIERITPIVRSKNLVKWEYVADAFTQASKPSWHDGGIWAPQIVLNTDNGFYYLYYSNSKWGDSNPGVGVARSQYPYGPFEDMGKVLDAQSSGVPNSIDQFYIQIGSGRTKHSYLFWGSYAGIWGQEISSDMKTLTGEKFKIAGNGFEGTYIYPKDGKFWYFGSNGNCCEGPNSQYRLSVAVADNIRGPYKTKDGKDIIDNGQEGTPFLQGSSAVGWVGPGHNAEIVRDDRGRYFILYHAISFSDPWLMNNPNGATRRPLMMDEIIWGNDGWPAIENGTPSSTRKTAPYFE
ncbi:MAG: family 43 glycosylhydrolase [Prevotellaceae bacterium]|jgi:arabinan endo-1,5-alpha-L-arabinosidase|nr:family 43 glycosylhydrolase [Prevotellaceae bacterium]